ncbi:hypothetical protein TVAG_124560 [Trichomonas vaginalis G3]|uniref:Uncharacterized protein n=1 Tax=Trichomonas vaginalis (strain ATCC PRA-98 / G3) TaxID=412133 RepID=A2FYN4_TRIV3|nr:hypothetical protein TVAGG3_0010720 [Trichomonas vaginalis G3]EAX89985.1 hypothetical protein TVAG_124560 [Trichomonas vaginalis G3]KAI5539124.1 hypothetical protein TVAGG3_0010720 [Trichomonas vaginalis G3]|eukprot:XP_001302915.1 hypothetical protein [Trichomonas vaginalis G3]
MSNKEGFSATIPAKKTDEEIRRDSLLDKGLDEIAAEKREIRKKERIEKKDERSKPREFREDRQKIIPCRISRKDIEILAHQQRINLNGYDVFVDAILTRKSRR